MLTLSMVLLGVSAAPNGVEIPSVTQTSISLRWKPMGSTSGFVGADWKSAPC